jgi:hypothetical protein
VRRDSGYDAWDLEVEGGAFGAARLRSCAEWHEKGRQLLRFDVRPAIRATAWTLILLGGSLVLWGIADGAALAPVVLGAATLATAARTVWECGTSAAAALEAVGDAVAAIETELVSEAELVASIEEPASAAVGGREWMRAAG